MNIRAAVLVMVLAATASAGADEFAIQREQTFEFAEKPTVTGTGDRFEIRFATKALCDVAIVIEDAQGRPLRHLACGVLGKNAPAPFAKDSTKQAIVWDGKDDQGVLVDQGMSVTARVSLGLKAQFERTLFWSPKKRIAPGNRPLFVSAPEGVYVLEGGGVDHIRLFDHEGNYVRTVYPFPPDYTSAEAKADSPKALQVALAKVQGLNWLQFPQDGKFFPEWHGLLDGTMLTSGTSAGRFNPSKYGAAASAMAIRLGNTGSPGHLALVMQRLNRVATDGTTGGLPLEGPKTLIDQTGEKTSGGDPAEAYPIAAAFSPDGKWLYLTGYAPPRGVNYGRFLPCVMRMDFAGDKPPELFLGGLKRDQRGKGDSQFDHPLSIACDIAGRIYVADYMNDRVQVFTPDGKLFKSVSAPKPLRVFVHPKTGDIYVASWLVVTPDIPDLKLKASFTHLGPVDNPKVIATYPLKLAAYSGQVFMNRTSWTHDLFMDFQTDPPTMWLVPGSGDTAEKLLQMRRTFASSMWQFSPWAESHYRLLAEKDGKLEEQANFAKDVGEAITRITPPSCPAHERQRLYVNPKDGMLYVMEGDSGVGKSTKELLRIDPNTGKVAPVKLPFSTEEIGFDLDGMIYLRTDIAVARYDPQLWREIPWDYGEEMTNPGFDGDGGNVIAAIKMPGTGKPGCFHLGGFGVSPFGRIVVSCYNLKPLELRTDGFDSTKAQSGKPYQPKLFPGRARWSEVHLWDKHGKLHCEDAVPGLPMTDGLFIDRDDNIYAMIAGNRMIDGKNYPLECAETLAKFKPRRGKVLSNSKDIPVPLGDGKPDRPPDIDTAISGQVWVQDAEWMYGGVGLDGFIPHRAPNCSCWNARFALDLHARSFATELGRSCVAVLDTNGNVIMRIGKYGNVDDGLPLVKAGGPANPRSIGGDEVALARACYVATDTDRRLFIADYGNYRIVCVKLGYHATETAAVRMEK